MSTKPIEDLLRSVAKLVPPVKGRPYPLPMFNFLNRYRPAVTFEVLVFRPGAKGTEVLLRERQPTDTGYAGKVHAPGSYLLMGESVSDCLARIVSQEIGDHVGVASYVLAGIVSNPFEERGHHMHHVYVVKLEDALQAGGTVHWYPTSDLPANLIPHHRPDIEMALRVYTNERAGGEVTEYVPG